jgi:hypothetical protein
VKVLEQEELAKEIGRMGRGYVAEGIGHGAWRKDCFSPPFRKGRSGGISSDSPLHAWEGIKGRGDQVETAGNESQRGV